MCSVSGKGVLARSVLAGLVIVLLLLQWCSGCQAAPLESYHDVYGRLRCHVEALVRPESTQQLAAVVRQFVSAAKAANKPLKIRTSRSVFHSTSSFACPLINEAAPTAAPVAEMSSQAPSTAAVLLDSFNKVLEVDRKAHTVRVQAGLKVLDLLRWAEANDMSMAPGAPPNYAELTVGGVISANGHGSGSNVSCQLGDIALEFTWIDGSGAVHTSQRNSAEGRGLAGGLGMIGIITEVKVQLTPHTKVKAVSVNMLPDDDLGETMVKHAKTTPNLAFMWRPDLKRYNMFLITPTDEPADADSKQGLVFTLPSIVANALQLVMLPLQADIGIGPVSHILNPVNCLKASVLLSQLRWATNSRTTEVTAAPAGPGVSQAVAVGNTNNVMAGGCEPSCTWSSNNGGITLDDTEFAIEMDELPAWVNDVKRLIAKDLQDDDKALDRCLPFGSYFLIRFGKGNSDYSSTTSGMKNPVFVELAYFRSRKLSHLPGKYQYLQDILEQRTLCKYNSRPHLGKNFDRTFSSADCPVRPRLPHFNKQLELQAKHDPSRIFEPELMRKLIYKTGSYYGPQCDLTRQCYCKADVHCAAGFACVPSLAFPEFKACKPAGGW